MVLYVGMPRKLRIEYPLAPLHARGGSCQRGPGATGDLTRGTTTNDPSYGLTPAMGWFVKGKSNF
jgi:hypothetical protein